MRAAPPDYYALLRVAPDATPETLRQAHKALLLDLHPDRNPEADPAHIARVNAAYEVLCDPVQRAAYDAQRQPKTLLRSAPTKTRREHQWPSGFDPAEQARHQRLTEERYARAKAEREAQERARKDEEASYRARREEELRQERLQAQARLAASRAKSVATDPEKARIARDTAEKAATYAAAERERKTPIGRRMVPASPEPEDRFLALGWKALGDIELIYTERDLPPSLQGTWEVLPKGLRWHGSRGSAVFIPEGEVDWALRQLYQHGHLPRRIIEAHLERRGHLGGLAWPIARGLFRVLARLPFFGLVDRPLALTFQRENWAPLFSSPA